MKAKSVASGLMAIAAVVGVCVTAYFCQKETPEANEALEQEKLRRQNEKAEKNETSEDSNENESEDISLSDALKIKGAKYKKTLISGGITIGLIVSGHIVQAVAVSSALGGMYFWQKKYRTLDSVIRKAHGTELYKDLEARVAKEVKKTGEAKTVKAPFLDRINKRGDLIEVFEPESEQFIETTVEKIQLAKNYLNSKYMNGEFVPINKFIKILGGKEDACLRNEGWTVDNEEQVEMMGFAGEKTIDFKIDTGISDIAGSRECLCIYYSIPPMVYNPTKSPLQTMDL